MSDLRMTWPQLRRRELEVNGHIVQLSPQLHLLATVFLLRRGQQIPVADLIEALWPDPDTQAETANYVIQVGTCRLRKLGLPIVPGMSRHYMLEPEGAAPSVEWLDNKHWRRIK